MIIVTVAGRKVLVNTTNQNKDIFQKYYDVLR